MNVLQDILARKTVEVRARKASTPESALTGMEMFSFRRLSLLRSLRHRRPAIIAEIKKASPSKGVIRPDFDPLKLAREFNENKAAALSVLTDEKFFQGELRFIQRMKKFVSVPILRKDFIIDSFQLCESKAFGADAVLLIASALEKNKLRDFMDQAKELDLECLVEVHDKEDVDKLDFSAVSVVGINNRDLTTFGTDITTSAKLRQFIPPEVEVVSESAIQTAADLRYLMENRIFSFLIGESLMRAGSPGSALAALIQGTKEQST